MYTLVHYKNSSIKGRYIKICSCRYVNKWDALADGKAIFDTTTDPNYAGFLIKDKDGNTICRRRKENCEKPLDK